MFVTGTGTNVGKTRVVGILAKQLQAQGLRVTTQKWVQTGGESDLRIHDQFIGAQDPSWEKWRMPYLFEPGVSPHLAAQWAGVVIDLDYLKDCYFELKKRVDVVIVEGAGGALVPYSPGRFLIDVAVDLALPIWVVIPNEVGALHAGFSTLESLRGRDIYCTGVVLNQRFLDVDPRIALDNAQTLSLAFPELNFMKVGYECD